MKYLLKLIKEVIKENERIAKLWIWIILVTLACKAITLAVNAIEKDLYIVSKKESFVMDALKEEKKIILEREKGKEDNKRVEDIIIDNKTCEPFVISGLSSDGINEKLKGTFLEGTGDFFYKVEQKYGVNFRFIYGIGSLESGYGKYLSGKYNYFGLTQGGQYNGYQNFKSQEEVILYMGRLLSSKTYKDKSIESIAKIYCPPNYTKWAMDVKSIMDEI